MGTKCLRQKVFKRGTNRCQYELSERLHCRHPADIVTWTPRDLKLNSSRTLLSLSLSLTVCSLLVSRFQATVTVHFRCNSMSTELCCKWNYKLDKSQSSTHSMYTYRAKLNSLFFWPHPCFHNCHTTTITNHHEAHTTADTFQALHNKFLTVIDRCWFQYNDTTVSYIHT